MTQWSTIAAFKEAVTQAQNMVINLRQPLQSREGRWGLNEVAVKRIMTTLPGIDMDSYIRQYDTASSDYARNQRRQTVSWHLRGPLTTEYREIDGVMNHQTVLDDIKANRMAYMIWRGYLRKSYWSYASNNATALKLTLYGFFDNESNKDDYLETNYDRLKTTLAELGTVLDQKLGLDEIRHCKRDYESQVETIQSRINIENNRNNSSSSEKSKFEELLTTGTVKPLTVIEAQIQKAYKMLPTNALVARTWGFEVEVPDAKQVSAPNGVEKGDDGSLRSYEANDDCECGCSGCNYHSCDCDMCYNQSDGDEHCGDGDCATADSAEYRSIGGIQRVISPALNKLCKDLNEVNAEMNDSAGTHIHVFGADLTTNQVGHVLAIYKRLEKLMEIVAGRDDVNYARRITMDAVKASLKKRGAYIHTDKPRAVNTTPLTSSRGTIEFRQMDCNLDAKRITLWAWMCRALVTSAKRGLRFNDVLGVTSLDDLIEVYAKHNVYLHDETPEEIVYGSRTDEGSFKRQQYATH